jgi:hypothetical protein
MNMKRQRGRNNGRNKPHMPQRPQNFESAGPEVRIRGNAYQVLEKYLALARDATAAGDRIAAENFYQHAEHYFRVINANNDGQRQHGGQQGNHPQQQHYAQNPQQQHPQQNQQPHHQQGQQYDHRMMAQPHDGGAMAGDGNGPQPLTGTGPNQGEPQPR